MVLSQETATLNADGDGNPSGWRVKLSDSCLRLGQFTRDTLRACALGTLNEMSRNAVTVRTYGRTMKRYRPRKVPFMPEEMLIPLLEELAPGKDLLDGFCGQGREAAMFASRGYRVVGIDNHPEMILRAKEYAQKLRIDAHYIFADFFNVELAEKFDVVYTSTEMYSAFLDRRRRRALLDVCRRSLKPNGIVIISFGTEHRTPLARRFFQIVTRSIGILTAGYIGSELGDLYYRGLFWHLFLPAEIDDEVDRSGFEIKKRFHTRQDIELLMLSPKTD